MSTLPETKKADALDVLLLTNSFRKIEPKADEFATTFYQILFDKYPKVRPLFTETDMDKQKKKLIESLQLVIANVHNPEAFTSLLKMLGKRHVGYGAVLTDYPLVGDALLTALERHLGDDWNFEVKQTWTLAYQFIADTMAEGAKTITKNPTNINHHSSSPTSPSPNPGFDFNDIAIDPVDSTAQTPIYTKLIILGFSGIVAIGGYMLWNMIQVQPNPNQPTSTQQSQ
jgi:hemoglobin-like flavoprotein